MRGAQPCGPEPNATRPGPDNLQCVRGGGQGLVLVSFPIPATSIPTPVHRHHVSQLHWDFGLHGLCHILRLYILQ